MSAARTIVYVEDLRPALLGVVQGYVRRGVLVVYRRMHPACESDRRLHTWHAEGCIRSVQFEPPLYLNDNRSGNQAFACIEPVFQEHVARSPLVRSIVELFNDEALEAAFKKRFLLQLTQYFYDALLLQRIGQVFHNVEQVIVLPAPLHRAVAFEECRRLVGSLQPVAGPRWVSPWWVSLLGALVAWGEKLLLVGYAALGLVSGIAQWIMGWGDRRPPQDYRFAVAMINQDREMTNPVRPVEFLADGECIRREELVFVPVGRITRSARRTLARRGLHVARRLTPISWDLVYRIGSAVRTVLVRAWGAPNWTVLVAAAAVMDYGRWVGFTQRYRVARFITYTDFGFRHIGRNVLLRRHGATTWHYMDSGNYLCLFTRRGEPPVRVPEWGYLLYDVGVVWNEFLVQYLAAHRPLVGRYVITGCLWAEHVRLIQEGRIPSTLREQAARYGWSPRFKLVSVFTSWYHPEAVASTQDGLRFLEDMVRLLESHPNLFILLKEKHPRWRFANHPVHGGRDAIRIYEFLDRLARHPRCFLPGASVNTSEAIAASDLVISFPFTSPSYEALSAGVKALFYDPYGKYRDVYYDQVPGLVAHGYQELVARVETLLDETTGDQVYAQLRHRIRAEQEPWLDAEALTRFRRLITQSDGWDGPAPTARPVREAHDPARTTV